ncbi:MAG: lipopolysaccharide transport periplasmic protein LptA [Mariprofundaceae bacterium]
MKLILQLTLTFMLMTTATWAGPIEVDSEKLAVDHAKNRAEFMGTVHVHQDEFDLYCDRLVTFYKQNMGEELERAEAYGHVRISQEKKRGAADKAIYEKGTGLVTLIGHAEVEDEGNILRGEKIVHNLETTETRVIKSNDGERVRLVIESDDDIIPQKQNSIETQEVDAADELMKAQQVQP